MHESHLVARIVRVCIMCNVILHLRSHGRKKAITKKVR